MREMQFEKPVSTVELSSDGKKSVFQIKPLERGYGLTIGNALRRVLLASMPGAAIVNVKIEGVDHEFQTIKGVYEDCMSIVLALKQVVIKTDSEDPNYEQKISLYKQGPCKICAGDFEKVTGLEIVNPELEIAHLMEGAEFNLTATVRRGVGYVNADDNKQFSKNQIGIIAIDSLFSPIKRVSYHVEKTRGDMDELNLEVETDGSIIAKDAVGIACKMLIDYFQEVKQISSSLASQKDYITEPVEEVVEEFEDRSVVSLTGLKVQVLNALKKKAIFKVSQLIELTDKELRTFDQIGPEAIKNIKEVLEQNGLALKDSKKVTSEE